MRVGFICGVWALGSAQQEGYLGSSSRGIWEVALMTSGMTMTYVAT